MDFINYSVRTWIDNDLVAYREASSLLPVSDLSLYPIMSLLLPAPQMAWLLLETRWAVCQSPVLLEKWELQGTLDRCTLRCCYRWLSHSGSPLTQQKASLGTQCGGRWTLVRERQVDKGYILYTFKKCYLLKKIPTTYEKLLLVVTDCYHKETPVATLNAAVIFPTSLCADQAPTSAGWMVANPQVTQEGHFSQQQGPHLVMGKQLPTHRPRTNCVAQTEHLYMCVCLGEGLTSNLLENDLLTNFLSQNSSSLLYI